LQVRGWETWVLHPDFGGEGGKIESKIKHPGSEIVPLVEGMCLSLDKSNRKRKASKVTRNRRNLTKNMAHKIDTLTMELVIPKGLIDIKEHDLESLRRSKDLLGKIRDCCCKSERHFRRGETQAEHMLILAIEKVEEGVLVHYQNLLPIFHPSAEQSGKQQSKEKQLSSVHPVSKTNQVEESNPRNNESREDGRACQQISAGENPSVPQKKHRVSASEKTQEEGKTEEEGSQTHENQLQSVAKDDISIVPQKKHRVSASEKTQEEGKTEEEGSQTHENQLQSVAKDDIFADTLKTNLEKGDISSTE